MLRRMALTGMAAALGLAAGLGTMAIGGMQAEASQAPEQGFTFPSIDGGAFDLADFRGRPVLVVNTASRCAFTGQYDGLQDLYDAYRDRGFVVLGVPSNSFNQELASEAAVRDFCEVNFGIDFPMTGIVAVTGADAHPFYAWAASQGVVPRWNFHKILLDGEGRIIADFPSQVGPDNARLRTAVEATLEPT
jgi:glutathione peroxidase